MSLDQSTFPEGTDTSRIEIAKQSTQMESEGGHLEKAKTCSTTMNLKMEKNIFILSNHHLISVAFDDIFTAPSAIESGNIGKHLSPRLRRVFGAVFNYTQEAIYYFMTIILGLFLGLIYGLVFGMISFMIVWFLHPTVTLVVIMLRVTFIPLTAFIRILVDPFCQSLSQVLASISVSLRLSPFRPTRRLGLESGGGLSPRSGPLSTIEGDANGSQEWLGYVHVGL